MEYYKIWTLSDLIETMIKFKVQISEDRVWKIIAQFFIGLSVMNFFNLAHRDVKDSNIFIDENDNIKIIDYSLSEELSFDSMELDGAVGTPFVSLYVYLFIFYIESIWLLKSLFHSFVFLSYSSFI
jgi:serine/threonine protein kinase